MNGASEETVDDALLGHLIRKSLELELACGRSDKRRQVADTWCGLCLAESNGTLYGARRNGLQVGNADAHADARSLAYVRRAPRELRKLGNQLEHEGGLDQLGYPLARQLRPLLEHDLDLVLDRARIVRPDLRTEAVLERRDDAAAAGVVLGVGTCDDEQVQGQP